ncbi:unnamed protein product [Sphagnum jensenii]|uniref:SET domain-containing protein n=1 Tax=Sphagnum jensenii TaxID=128206 RepID=A0ABP0VHG5_9BRYO
MRLEDKSYLMRLGEQSYVDSKESNCFARYINDCRNPAGYNVKFIKFPLEGFAHVVALRAIKAGEELFVNYGSRYWAGSPVLPIRLSFSELLELKEK